VSPSPFWYLTRGSGVVALLLLTASVALGVVNQVRWKNRTWPRFALQDVHKNISLLALAVVGLHVVASVFDTFAPIGWRDALLPFLSSYRPVWLGLGTLASDIFLAILITSLLRPRIDYRLWRVVHWLSYACWPVALLHSLGTGTDVRAGWMQALAVVSIAVVVASIWWRIAAGWPSRRAVRVVALVASALAPFGIAAFAYAGPLAHGWARRAGTPPALLAKASPSTPAASAAAPVARPSLPAVPFSSSFVGTLTERESEDETIATVLVRGTLRNGAVLAFEIRGAPLEEGGVSMQTSAAEFGTPDSPTTYRGTVAHLRGTDVILDVSAPGRQTLQIEMNLILGDGGRVTGDVTGVAASG